MQLTEHFTLAEFTHSQTAARLGIDNTPTDFHINRLRKLCTLILEPARKELGALTISSGYRNISLNRAIGGSPSSAHCLGYAADVIPMRVSKHELAHWIADRCKFDQLILEFGTLQEPAWIHVSCDPRTRMQILRAYGRPTRYEALVHVA